MHDRRTCRAYTHKVFPGWREKCSFSLRNSKFLPPPLESLFVCALTKTPTITFYDHQAIRKRFRTAFQGGSKNANFLPSLSEFLQFFFLRPVMKKRTGFLEGSRSVSRGSPSVFGEYRIVLRGSLDEFPRVCNAHSKFPGYSYGDGCKGL